jgi:hypothetical protein
MECSKPIELLKDHASLADFWFNINIYKWW